MAGQLTEHWTQSTWGQVARLLAKPLDFGSPLPSPRPRQHQVQVRLDQVQAYELAAAYEAGASLAKVSKSFHVSPETASRHIKRTGGQTRICEPAIPSSEVPQALALRAQGWSYEQIGKHYGCSHTTVRNTLLRSKNLAGA